MFGILEQQVTGRRSWVARNSLGGKSHTMWFQNDTPPIFYAHRSNAERDAEWFSMLNARQRRTTYTVVEVAKVDEWRQAVDQQEGYVTLWDEDLARCETRSAHR